jgi:hypothetical protein
MLLGDLVFSFYVGASQTQPSSLHVTQPARGNDATMHAVPWAGYPFRFSPYYGLRLSYNPPGHPQTRIALDYTHYKIYAPTEDTIEQDGTWHGAPLHTAAPMRERVQSFEITHGVNMFGLSILQNVSGIGASGVYVGAGPVIFVPHTENRVDGLAGGDGDEYGGWGFQFHGGIRGCIGERPLFAEFKYNLSEPITVPIAQGTAQTSLHTVHELGGFDFGPCRRW